MIYSDEDYTSQEPSAVRSVLVCACGEWIFKNLHAH